MTTSVNVRPAAWRSRSRRTSTGGSSVAIASRAARTASAGARSMSTSTLRRISRAAAVTTRKATKSAASESPAGQPARTATSPMRTASVPTRSLPKWSAFDEKRGARVRSRGPHRDGGARDVDRDHERRRPRTPTRPSTSRSRSSRRAAPTASAPTARLTSSEDARLGERGEVLGLPVAVGVRAVGGTAGDADREEREQRRDEVGAGVQRLRDEAEAAAREARARA